MRSESMSPTLSATTSETRSPAPPAFAGAGSGGGKRRLVLWRRCRAQQRRHLLDAEHRRYPPRLRHDQCRSRTSQTMIRYKQLWTVEAAFGTAKHGTPIQKTRKGWQNSMGRGTFIKSAVIVD
jgi:hypothetical protein